MSRRGLRGRWRRFVGVAIAVTCLAGAGLAGFIGAHVIRLYDGSIPAFAERMGVGVARRWKRLLLDTPLAPDEASTVRFSSIFFPLRGQVVQISDPSRNGEGGGLTSWGRDVVVITHEGKIWLVDEAGSATLSRIEPPFNGFEDYVTAARQPPFDRLAHDFRMFRYNDITRFEMPGRRGLIVSYTRFYAGRNCYATVISRLDVDVGVTDLRNVRATAGDWQDVFETSPCLPFLESPIALVGYQAGGAIDFDGAGTLYLASGDYAWDGMEGASLAQTTDPGSSPNAPQDPATDYGKVIAIDLLSGQARHVSRGHRNPQGIALDGEGRVWATEHGPRGGDELNLIVEGGNYGWPLVAYGTRYAALPLSEGRPLGRHDGFRRPMFAWLPSIGISGLAHVRGFHEAWDGDLVAASLIGQKLVHIRVIEDRVAFTEFIETGRRVRQVHQHTDGRLVLWTSLYEVIFLEPGGSLALGYLEERLAEMAEQDVPVARVRAAIESCMQCHSLEVGEHASAPSLAMIFGAPVGSTSFTGYSQTLRGDGRIWTRDLLAAYLRDPQQTLPGTAMPDPGLDDERVIEGVISLLEGLATTR